MGVSSSNLLDETKCNYIRGRTEAELNNFSPHYKRQHNVAFFSQLRDEVEQHHIVHTYLLKQKDPPQASELLYKDSVLHSDDGRKWKERFVVVHADYSLELHDSKETFAKGTSARQKLQLTGGAVLTSEEKYCAMVDKTFPDLNSSKEESPSPLMTTEGLLPVYLRLPYKRDAYFSFQQEDERIRFISIMSDCIRHQNHDCLKQMTCDVQTFLKAINFYRQEKGHYESWEMLVGTDCQALTNLVMEELLPSLQKDLLPKLKGKKADRKRVWFAMVEVTYELVQDQLRGGLERLKEESRVAAKQLEALIRSDMDQIISSRNFLETKLQGLVKEPASKFCSDSVSPYLASILEELMGPISLGFEAVRQRLEAKLSQLCKDFQPGGTSAELAKALEEVSQGQLEDCYQHVSVLKEQLQDLHSRFRFSNSTLVVHNTQSHMQQLMENAVYTFEKLLQSAMKNKPEEVTSVMEKAKHRILKQYDYDSSTVRKRIFQEALVNITLPCIRRNLASCCKTELQKYEQYVFADYTNFIQVENVYEDILLNTLNNEVNKVVKEAAALKKHNLYMDNTEQHCISQSSLIDSRTPPRSIPSSPAKVLASNSAKKDDEQKSSSSAVENKLADQPLEGKLERMLRAEPSQSSDAELSKSDELSVKVAPSVPAPASMDTSTFMTRELDVASFSNLSDVTSPNATNIEANEVIAVAPKICPTIIISKPASPIEHRQATAHTINPTELNQESPVPLDLKEKDSDKTEIDAPTPIHAEICKAMCAPLEKPQLSTVQPDPSDSPINKTNETPVENPPCSLSPAETSETLLEFSTNGSANGLPILPTLPAEAADSPKSAPIESEDCSDTEAEEPADSVKAIRDLVVEIIEVEDTVSLCPQSRETPF